MEQHKLWLTNNFDINTTYRCHSSQLCFLWTGEWTNPDRRCPLYWKWTASAQLPSQHHWQLWPLWGCWSRMLRSVQCVGLCNDMNASSLLITQLSSVWEWHIEAGGRCNQCAGSSRGLHWWNFLGDCLWRCLGQQWCYCRLQTTWAYHSRLVLCTSVLAGTTTGMLLR